MHPALRTLMCLATAVVTLYPARANAEPTIFHRANVIDGTGNAAFTGDVTVSDSRITRVNPQCSHPPGARVIDATGKYLLPGFIDMHVHLLEHGRDEKGEISPRVDWDVVRLYLRLLLQHGVTTVRDPGSETESAVTLRRLLADGAIAGPRLLTAGRIINASPFNPEPFRPVSGADDLRREIQWQKASGVDFIKIYSAMPPELVSVAVREAHRLGLPVIGHLQRTTWEEAARRGIDFIAHGAPWTPDLLPAEKQAGYTPTMFGRVYWLENLRLDAPAVVRTLETLYRSGVVVDPTLIAYHTKFFGNDARWRQNSDHALLPAAIVNGWTAGHFTRDWTPAQFAAAQRAWPAMLSLTKAMFDAGVRLTVGTDAPTAWIVPGPSFHDELLFLRDAGIPPAAILRMATSDAARALRIDHQTGSIRSGLEADLVLLSKNPLHDIAATRSIELVMHAGKIVNSR